MPDITMCEGKDCPLKSKCHRYTVKPDEQYQAYYVTPPYEQVDEVFTCDCFWPNDGREPDKD